MYSTGLHSLQDDSHRRHEDAFGGVQGFIIDDGIYIQISKTSSYSFPSSSHMFRELMPELADDFHLIAPDFPAFGQTKSPNREDFITRK